jgi:hypothetical protein
MNNLSRVGAQGFLHHEAQLGNVRLVSRVAMRVVMGVFALFAGGHYAMGATPAAANPSQEIAAAKAKKEAARLAKLQPLIAKQLEAGREAADEDKWGKASKAAAKVLKMDPDHAVAQELKRRASWGPLPEKTLGNLKYKVHPIHQACAITGVLDNKNTVAFLVLPDEIEGRPLIRIGREAFLWCKVLESVTIQSSVTSIGDEAFATCFNLVNLSVAAGNPVYEADGGVLFTKGGKTLLLYPQGKPGETYIIPSSVTSIGKRAFQGCKALKSVTISSSETRIEEYVFSGCKSLESVMFPKGVKIGRKAFEDCPWQPSE